MDPTFVKGLVETALGLDCVHISGLLVGFSSLAMMESALLVPINPSASRAIASFGVFKSRSYRWAISSAQAMSG